jgi:xylulokinase
MQADVFGQTVKTINASEGPAFGVALLAGVGAGAFKDIREACDSCIRVTRATRPKPQAVRLYNRNYPMFQKLYRSLEGDFAELTRLSSAE